MLQALSKALLQAYYASDNVIKPTVHVSWNTL